MHNTCAMEFSMVGYEKLPNKITAIKIIVAEWDRMYRNINHVEDL